MERSSGAVLSDLTRPTVSCASNIGQTGKVDPLGRRAVTVSMELAASDKVLSHLLILGAT